MIEALCTARDQTALSLGLGSVVSGAIKSSQTSLELDSKVFRTASLVDSHNAHTVRYVIQGRKDRFSLATVGPLCFHNPSTPIPPDH